MPVSIDQVLAGMTEEQALDGLLDVLREIGFSVDSWQDGSVRKTLVRAVARTMHGHATAARNMVVQAFIRPAGAWQDLVGEYWYRQPRLEAVRTVRPIAWTSAASAPPHLIAPSSLVETSAGIRYRSTNAVDVALAPGSTVTISCEAVTAGEAGNVPGSTPLRLVTAYAGTTASFSGDITTAGADRESDARYQERLDRRFEELTYSVGLRAYELWALRASPATRRVRALNDFTSSTITVVLDPGTPAEISAASFDIAQRSPPHDLVSVVARTTYPQTIALSPRIRAGRATVAQIEAAIRAYLDGMPIGGVRVAGSSAGRLLRDEIARSVLCTLDGVESVGLTVPASDVVLGPTEIIAPTFVITPEIVP